MNQRGIFTGTASQYDFSSAARGVPVTADNPDQLGKGKVFVHYVDTKGNVLKEQAEADYKDALPQLYEQWKRV